MAAEIDRAPVTLATLRPADVRRWALYAKFAHILAKTLWLLE
jgi:hypothetical protein